MFEQIESRARAHFELEKMILFPSSFVAPALILCPITSNNLCLKSVTRFAIYIDTSYVVVLKLYIFAYIAQTYMSVSNYIL